MTEMDPPHKESDSDSGEDSEDLQYGDHTEASKEALAKQQEAEQMAEVRRRMQAMVVPTDPGKVRAMLRTLREPVTLFGERELERRERLRKLLVGLDEGRQQELTRHLMEVEVHEAARPAEKFYTEGPDALPALRRSIAQFAAQRARARLEDARLKAASEAAGEEPEWKLTLKEVSRMAQVSSQIGGSRPVQGAAISPDNATLLAGDWRGAVTLWNLDDLTQTKAFAAHEERVTDVAWHPNALCANEAGDVQAPEALCFATASADGSAKWWNMDGKCLHTCSGHTDRLARLAFHPNGESMATCSYDGTWRLWDTMQGQCVMEQEGHSRAVYCVAFHPDGSLCGSGALDAATRVWDCRTGRNIMTFEGHVRPVLSLDFSPNGYHVATGSEDNSVRIWDLRKRGVLYTIAGHFKLVSATKFDPFSGHYLLSASYDHTAKVWSTRDWTLTATLAGHEGMVMCADITRDGTNSIVTTSYDKTIKLWRPEELEEDGHAGMQF